MLGALQVTVPGHGCTLLGDRTQFEALVLSCQVLFLPCLPLAALQAAPVLTTVSLLLWKLFPPSFL